MSGCSGVWGQCCSDGGCRMLGPAQSYPTHLHIGLITNTNTPIQFYPHCAVFSTVPSVFILYIIITDSPSGEIWRFCFLNSRVLWPEAKGIFGVGRRLIKDWSALQTNQSPLRLRLGRLMVVSMLNTMKNITNCFVQKPVTSNYQ